MNKKAFVLAAALFFTLSPLMAITFGVPDGNEHPYVGMVLFTPDFESFYVCSGTLIAPQVFLTAGHCAAEAPWAWVTFDEVPDFEGFPAGWKTGSGVAHPDFGPYVPPNTNDIGVIRLDEPVTLGTYGVLAPLAYLDTFKKAKGLQSMIFEPVGYGVNSYKPRYEWVGNRYKGQQRLINLSNSWSDGYNIMLTNSPGLGNGVGGTCSGDSGGPILVDGTNIVVAVNSFGVAPWCKGNDYAYRVDIQNSYDFLAEYVSLP